MSRVPDPTRLSRRVTTLLVGAFLGLFVAALLSVVSLPYVILKPGPITDTLGKVDGKPLIDVSGARTYPTTGELSFTTVRIFGGPGYKVNAWHLVEAWIDPHITAVPVAEVYPEDATDEQIEEENQAEMASSQQEAVAVALTALGEDVKQVVTIDEVPKDSPNAGLLKAGDELVSVDGVPATDSEAAREAIMAREPGEKVKVVVRRDGDVVTVDAPTRETEGRTALGIFLGGRFDFPYEVRIHAGDVGGPSAGLMFTLGIYDVLTPGPLTGGAEIAGTGTIATDGGVGPIGGIQQKLAGAQDGGADWFLAPQDNCGEVRGHVPDGLRVVSVDTFEDARAALEAIAAGKGSSLPTCDR